MKRLAFLIIGVMVVCLLGVSAPVQAQIGEPFHGYILLELSGPLAGGLTADQQLRVKQAFEVFAPTRGEYPPYLLSIRLNLAKTKAIIETRFHALPSKAQVVNELSARLGISTSILNNNLTFTVFGGVNATIQQSREAAQAYLQTSIADWESQE